ncbi:hypothetical protein [Arthrobacter zhaoguopingii]|uniref:hypothetical protein n=1 Tax=Arthrobacter zhaoguopingii TaxID=2681491 RepID=UPI001357DDD8|nr:hypothetical protein [Arthrobacter zhaoguopingii]
MYFPMFATASSRFCGVLIVQGLQVQVHPRVQPVRGNELVLDTGMRHHLAGLFRVHGWIGEVDSGPRPVDSFLQGFREGRGHALALRVHRAGVFDVSGGAV